jgi:hypothetical protein
MNNRQTEARTNIVKLRNGITDIIDKICEESGYEITYPEIHQSLIDTLNEYNRYPLKELWTEDEK